MPVTTYSTGSRMAGMIKGISSKAQRKITKRVTAKKHLISGVKDWVIGMAIIRSGNTMEIAHIMVFRMLTAEEIIFFSLAGF
jgi:hypothetical protein